MNKPKQQKNQTPNYTVLIKEFLTTIKEQFFSAKKLEGGTQNQTFLVNRMYVFKIGPASKIEAELIYNNYYKNEPFVQKLVFCDKNYRFIVYKYIAGEILPEFPNSKKLLKQTLKFVKNYKPYFENGYGDLNKPSNTWTEFLTKLISDCKSDLKQVFEKSNFNILNQSVQTLENYEFEKVLLHGDLRLENFIFENGQLNGIIDPYPMSGDKLYDQLFFIISTPELSKQFKLQTLHKKLKQPKEKVKALLLIVLCVKIKRMVKYNNQKEQLTHYLELWNKVFNL